jgi:TonB-dependent SusC/RagA subfamily outer membrane receptor
LILTESCPTETFSRLNMLFSYESINAQNWYETLAFGIENKVVTPQAAYIVLERIEDYVTYNITPPDDIMQECLNKGFVKTDYRQRYYHMQKMADAEMLKQVAAEYNKRISLWDDPANHIRLTGIADAFARIEAEKKSAAENISGAHTNLWGVYGQTAGPGGNMSEVVVTAYSINNARRNMTGSVTTISGSEISRSASLGAALQGRVAGLDVKSSSGYFETGSIKMRGIRSLRGDNNPLIVLDGLPVDFEWINLIPTSDIAEVSVLRSAQAATQYGSRAANGAILIKTKKGRSYGYVYNQKASLKEQEDTDYMIELKNTPLPEKTEKYNQLLTEYKTDIAFYLDVAMHFHDAGLREQTDEILLQAAELSNNSMASQLAIAYVYEYMKEYQKAAEIYSVLAVSYPAELNLQRNLAWAYYQQGLHDSAVQVLYRGILKEDYAGNANNMKIKDMMLADMNMIITLHPGEVNTRFIPAEILKPVAADIRILFDANYTSLYDLRASEGKKQQLSNYAPTTEGRRLQASWYLTSTAEYQVKEAGRDRVRFTLNHYSYYWYDTQVPPLVKIITIKNFGKSGQQIRTEIVSLKNQSGEVEIADYR